MGKESVGEPQLLPSAVESLNRGIPPDYLIVQRSIIFNSLNYFRTAKYLFQILYG